MSDIGAGPLIPRNGGTGVVNANSSTVTLGGSFEMSGAYTFVGTLTGNTTVTFPTSGTLATTSQLPSFPLSGADGGTGVANTGLTINLGSASSGYILTSDSDGNATWQAASGSGAVTTLDGNSGSATPSGGVITITTGSSNANGTALFTGSSSTLSLTFSDSNSNTGIGNGCMLSVSGSSNTGMGQNCLEFLAGGVDNDIFGAGAGGSITSGSYNCGVGHNLFGSLSSGQYNVGLGLEAGSNYAGSESSNIVIGNAGTASESNAIHIGTQGDGDGQQNACYIAGINSADSSGFSSPLPIYVDSDTGQLGYGSGGGGSITLDADSGSASGSTITISGNSEGTLNTSASSATLTINVQDSYNNVVLGNVSFTGSVSASSNVGVGSGVLASNSTGYYHVAIGAGALASNASSQGCVAIGYGSQALGTGQEVTSLGAQSFNNLVSGGYNIGIGYTAGTNYTSSESSNILIGNSGTIGESNVIRIGSQGDTARQQNVCYIAGINSADSSGFTSPLAVYVDSDTGQLGYGSGGGGSLTLDGDSGSATGSTITLYANTASNNSGASVSFSNSGTTSLLNLTDSTSQDTSLGYEAGSASNISNSANCFVGYQAGKGNSGAQNVSVGYQSYYSTEGGNSGSANTIIGNSAYYILGSVGSGSYNICIGTLSGGEYTGSESNNILINSYGVTGESNVIRIGTQPISDSPTACYIAGISGASPVSDNTPQVVLCDSDSNLTVISSGSSGYVLTSNGSATPSFQAASFSTFTVTALTHSSSPYSASANQFLAITGSTGTFTVKLPNAPATGTTFVVKDTNGSSATYNIAVTTVGGTVTIDGSTTYTMATNYQAISLIFDGSNYEVF